MTDVGIRISTMLDDIYGILYTRHVTPKCSSGCMIYVVSSTLPRYVHPVWVVSQGPCQPRLHLPTMCSVFFHSGSWHTVQYVATIALLTMWVLCCVTLSVSVCTKPEVWQTWLYESTSMTCPAGFPIYHTTCIHLCNIYLNQSLWSLLTTI